MLECTKNYISVIYLGMIVSGFGRIDGQQRYAAELQFGDPSKDTENSKQHQDA